MTLADDQDELDELYEDYILNNGLRNFESFVGIQNLSGPCYGHVLFTDVRTSTLYISPQIIKNRYICDM